MTLPFDEPGVELLQSAIQHAVAVGVAEAELQSAREQLPVLQRAAARADRERAAALRSGSMLQVLCRLGARTPPGSLPARGPPGQAAWGDLCRRPCSTVHSVRLTLRLLERPEDLATPAELFCPISKMMREPVLASDGGPATRTRTRTRTRTLTLT